MVFVLGHQAAFKHGMTYSGEWNAWAGMKQRCYNPKNHKYHMYGARWISVCSRWLNSFENFFADMGPKPSPQHSLDRYPNRNGNYEPSNCRWATKQEQANNLRSAKQLEFNGKIQSQAAWAREIGISAVTLRDRLARWSLERALTTPKFEKGPK